MEDFDSDGMEVRVVSGALVLRGSDDSDWYCIERAEHEGIEEIRRDPKGNGGFFFRSARPSDADVEGPLLEMLGIAKAIEDRTHEGFKRCAVDVKVDAKLGQWAEFWSPRNSQVRARVPLSVADALAKDIRQQARNLGREVA